MLAGMADFTQNDLTNWAQGQAGAAPSGDEDPVAAGDGAPEEEESSGGSDPCEVLRQAANELEKASGVIASITLKDDEDKAFVKRWDAIQEAIEEQVEEARSMADDHEAAHEDDEDEEPEDDEEAPKKGAGPDKDDEDEDKKGGKGKAPPFGKKD